MHRSTSASASAANIARICVTTFGLRMRDRTVARLRVQRRIGLQDQALRPKRRLRVEVRQADARTRDEGCVIVEHRMHLGVASAGNERGYGVQLTHRPRFAHVARASDRGRAGSRRGVRIEVEFGDVVRSRSSGFSDQCTAMPTRRSSVAVSFNSSSAGARCATRAAFHDQRAALHSPDLLHLLLHDHDGDARSAAHCVEGTSNSCRISGARPSSGSSSSSRRGRPSNARATDSICCSPPENCEPPLRRRSASRGNKA